MFHLTSTVLSYNYTEDRPMLWAVLKHFALCSRFTIIQPYRFQQFTPGIYICYSSLILFYT